MLNLDGRNEKTAGREPKVAKRQRNGSGSELLYVLFIYVVKDTVLLIIIIVIVIIIVVTITIITIITVSPHGGDSGERQQPRSTPAAPLVKQFRPTLDRPHPHPKYR